MALVVFCPSLLLGLVEFLRNWFRVPFSVFQALVHVGRSSRGGQLQRSTYQDEVPKTADKMMALMTIATSLAPGAKIDEQVRL